MQGRPGLTSDTTGKRLFPFHLAKTLGVFIDKDEKVFLANGFFWRSDAASFTNVSPDLCKFVLTAAGLSRGRGQV